MSVAFRGTVRPWDVLYCQLPMVGDAVSGRGGRWALSPALCGARGEGRAGAAGCRGPAGSVLVLHSLDKGTCQTL